MTRIHVLTPTYKPVGGVVKIFDYVRHCQALGLEPIVYGPEPVHRDMPLFAIEHIAGLFDSVRFEQLPALRVVDGDLAMFSWPKHYDQVTRRADRGVSYREVIHLVQSTRHANPRWIGGYATRLLTRPITRVIIAEQIRTACESYMNTISMTSTIIEGHAWEYFARSRNSALGQPIRVGYTTWKSDIGRHVEVALADSEDFTFRHISETVSWSELHDLYQWCDVFLAAPGPQEGFYLPGLESMASGALLITPDVGGNLQYCKMGVNCIEVTFEDVASYTGALKEVASMTQIEINEIRRAAEHALHSHTLDREQHEFGELVSTITEQARDEII